MDETRQTSHALLRMLFQFTLPESFDNVMSNESIPLFGESSVTNNFLQKYMLKDYGHEFDTEVLSEIANQVEMGCNIPKPNVVILEPGNPPNCDDNVHGACEILFKNTHGYLC